MSALGERSVRIREVEGSNPFRSTKMKTVRKGGFHFAVGLRESKFIPPLRGKSLQVHQIGIGRTPISSAAASP